MRRQPGPRRVEGVPQFVDRGARASTNTAAVAFGLLITSVTGGVQALLIAWLAGDGPKTDGFLAAYSVYSLVAVVAISMRRSLVAELPDDQGDARFRAAAAGLSFRVRELAWVVACAMALAAYPLAVVLTAGTTPAATRAAVGALLLFALAGSRQISVGGMAAVLNAAHRLPASIAFYVAAGLTSVVASALLLAAFGVLGAGIGITFGAVALSVMHTLYLRRFGIAPSSRVPLPARAELGKRLGAGAALGASQQASLTIALAAVARDPGAITAYTYAFFAMTLMLNLTTTPIALVVMPRLVRTASRSKASLEEEIVLLAPYAYWLLVPMLAAAATFGPEVLNIVFGSSLSSATIDELYRVILILEAWAVVQALFVLTTSAALAKGSLRAATQTAMASVVVHIGVLTAVAPYGIYAVATAHAVVGIIIAITLVATVFGSRASYVVGRAAQGAAAAALLALVFPVMRIIVADSPSYVVLASAVAASAIYVVLSIVLRKRVSAPFVDLLCRAIRPRW